MSAPISGPDSSAAVAGAADGFRRDVEQILQASSVDRELFPNFGRYSICGLIPTVADLLGLTSAQARDLSRRSLLNRDDGLRRADLATGQRDNVLLLLVDSVSYDFYQRAQARFDFWPADSLTIPLSSVFPTITQACLPSIWAGGGPATHGIYGRLFYLPEAAETVGPFFRSARSVSEGDPDDMRIRSLLRIPSLAATLIDAGAEVRVRVTKNYPRFGSIIYGDLPVGAVEDIRTEEFSSAGVEHMLAQMRKRDTSILGLDLQLLREAFAEFRTAHERPRLIFVHFLAVGQIAHVFDVESDEYLETVAPFFVELRTQLAETLAQADGQSAILLSSDHGTVRLDHELTTFIDARTLEEIEPRCRALPAGNQRSAYFFPKANDDVSQLVELLEKRFGATAVVNSMTEDLHLRLFGTGERFRERVEGVVLMNKGLGLTQLAYDLKYKGEKTSDHGGLHPKEMLVPFAFVPA